MHKILRCFALAAICIGGLVFCGVDAGAVTLSRQNNADTFDGGGKLVVSGISNRSGRFYAGGFRVTDGTQNFIAWCLDVLHNLSLPGNYKVTDTPFNNPNTVSLNLTQKTNIERLFETNYSTLDVSGSAAGNAQSAGFQLALWEIVYENTNVLNVSNGSWTVTSPAEAIATANTFLGSLGKKITKNYRLTFYQSDPLAGKPQSQNLVSATAIPVPPSGLLLGAGLLGLGYLLRSRKAV